MDENLYFHKAVIEKHEVDKILTPVNLGNGELVNVGLSDLRKELDLCYQNIEKSTLKEKLLGYLEDYTLDLIAENIPQKKDTLKFIKGKRKKLTKQHPNLDYDNEEDEVVIEKINALTWKLEQEKYIFHYLKEQKIFLRDWVTQKWVEYKNTEKEKMQLNVKMKSVLSKASFQKKNKTITKPLPFYCQVGALFAQGFISKKKFECVYNDGNVNKIFEDISKLSKYIQENILKTENVIRPYINDTLSEGDERKAKDFYKSKGMMKNIIKYCKTKNINITSEFQSIHDNLIK